MSMYYLDICWESVLVYWLVSLETSSVNLVNVNQVNQIFAHVCSNELDFWASLSTVSFKLLMYILLNILPEANKKTTKQKHIRPGQKECCLFGMVFVLINLVMAEHEKMAEK